MSFGGDGQPSSRERRNEQNSNRCVRSQRSFGSSQPCCPLSAARSPQRRKLLSLGPEGSEVCDWRAEKARMWSDSRGSAHGPGGRGRKARSGHTGKVSLWKTVPTERAGLPPAAPSSLPLCPWERSMETCLPRLPWRGWAFKGCPGRHDPIRPPALGLGGLIRH